MRGILARNIPSSKRKVCQNLRLLKLHFKKGPEPKEDYCKFVYIFVCLTSYEQYISYLYFIFPALFIFILFISILTSCYFQIGEMFHGPVIQSQDYIIFVIIGRNSNSVKINLGQNRANKILYFLIG